MAVVRLGLVGTGRIGRVHVETLMRRVPGAELVAVTDQNLDLAQAVATEYGVPSVADSFEELISIGMINALIICSSTDTHVDYIIRAAEAGKHIFCEKPIAIHLQEIDRALDVVKRCGVKLMVGFNRRFDANALRIKAIIDSGEIGSPHQLTIISRDPAPPPLEYLKVSGGMFYDMTIHDFDMARYLFGDVTEVYAAGDALIEPAIRKYDDIDTAVITLKFANGAYGVIENSRKAVYGYDQRIEAFCSAGSALSANQFADAVTINTSAHVRTGLPMNFFMERYLSSYQLELTEFIRALANDDPLPVSGEDGRAPVVIAQAAMLSLHENRPVQLSEIG